MLVLMQKVGNRTFIRVPPSASEQVIEVALVDAKKGRARIGYVADRSIQIDREKVLKKKEAEAVA